MLAFSRDGRQSLWLCDQQRPSGPPISHETASIGVSSSIERLKACQATACAIPGSSNAGGGGGGGGAYASSVVTVVPGTGYTVVVGSGGAHTVTVTTAGPAASGGNSSFGTTTVVAAGGAGGTDQTPSGNGAGGAGATTAASTGTTKFSGGNGSGASTTIRGGNGGSSAGTAANGNNGSTSATGATIAPSGGGNGGTGGNPAGNVGASGVAPGGAGGGGYTSGSGLKIGGNGAAGQVILTYTIVYDHVNVETAADGSGSVVGAQSVSSGSPITVYAIARASDNSFLVNCPATWSLVNISGNVVSGDLVASGDTKSAVFTGHLSGSANIQATSANATGSPNFNTSGLITVPATGAVGTWSGGASGDWSVAGNWTGTGTLPPQTAGDLAIFGTGSSPVNLDTGESMGAVTFNTATAFTISGSQTLTLDNSTSGALISMTSAAGTPAVISTPLSLNDNATITVNSGKTLNVSGIVSSTSTTKTLTVNGAGTTILGNANTYGPAADTVGTTLSGGGTLQVGNNNALGAGDVSVTSSSTLQSGAAGLSVANKIAVSSAQTATVDNNGNILTLSGVVSGGGALIEIGSGTLTLAGANTYSGGTTVTAGTVALSGAGTLGSSASALTVSAGILDLGGLTPTVGAVTISGGTIQNGTLTGAGYTGTETTSATISAALAGSAGVGVTNSGSGTLTLSGNNTFSGGILLNSSGTLTLSGNNTFSGGIALNSSGTLQLQANSGNTTAGVSSVLPTVSMTLAQLPSGSTIQLRADSTVASGGVVTFDSGTTAFGVDLADSRLTGTLNFDVNQLTTGSTATTLQFGAPASSTWNIGGGSANTAGLTTTFNVTGGAGYALQLGALVFGNNANIIFNTTTANLIIGAIGGGTGTLTKNGAGTLTITGAGTLTGVTTINAGTLALSGSGSIAGSPTVTVATGATLDVSAVTPAGYTLGSGTLTMNINKSGSTSQGQIVLGGKNITFAGSLTVTASGSALAAGDSFPLITTTGGSTFSGWFSSVTLPALAGGLVWDTNKLATTGVLSVFGFTTNAVQTMAALENTATTLATSKLTAKTTGALGTVTVSSVSSASGATVSISGGNIDYTPATGFTGTDTFTAVLSDGHDSITATVVVTVSAANVGPTLSLGSGYLNNGGFGSFTSSGIPNETYDVEVATSMSGPWVPANNGTVTAAANGVISYTDTETISAYGGTVFYRLAQQ